MRAPIRPMFGRFLRLIPRVLPVLAMVMFSLVFLVCAYAEYDFMILCPEEYEDALEPLKSHKDRTGISTRIVTLESLVSSYPNMGDAPFVDEPERIKYAIYDHFNTYGIQYVMLVGDCNVFPVRFILGELDDWSSKAADSSTTPYVENIWEPTDFYYADILDASGGFADWDRDGNERFCEIWRGTSGDEPGDPGINWDEIDYHPDVYLARVPADSVEEVQNYVTKIIRYETVAHGSDWFDDMMISASDDPDWNTPPTTEAIVNALSPLGFTFTRYYHSGIPAGQFPAGVTSDGDPTPANLLTTFGGGVGFVYHHSHGSRTAWSGIGFNKGHVATLTNEFELPVIFATSCETARYCPYIPYNTYRTKAGAEQAGVARGSIDDDTYPEPNPIQGFNPVTMVDYNKEHTIAEEFIVASEAGAVAYWGCTNTGEGVAKTLGREFFTSYTPGITLGEMWYHAVEAYSVEHNLSRFDRNSSGGAGTMWTFHHPQRFHIFGDPSLRVGGVPGIPPDTEPPTTSANISSDWYTDGFVLELRPVDNPATDGSGVRSTFLRINGGVWEETRSHAFSVAAGGTRTYHIEYYSVDFFNNQESPAKTAQIQLEAIRPADVTMTLDGDPPMSADADYGGPVTVTVQSSDADSGVDSIFVRIEKRVDTYGPDTGYYTNDGWEYFVNAAGTPGAFSDTFEMDHAGRYRLTAWAVDGAGNESASDTVREFTSWFVNPEPGWLDDLAHILQGPFWIVFPPELDLPFAPLQVSFYTEALDDKWVLLGTDSNSQDGWQIEWNTAKFSDGLYNLRALVRGAPQTIGPAYQEETVLMGTFAVRNRPSSEYEFELDVTPRTAARGEPVSHEIRFVNKTQEVLDDLEIAFDISSDEYDKIQGDIDDGGSLDKENVIHWTRKSMKHGEEWVVHFRVAAAPSVPSGQTISNFAYLRSNEIPIITSDDPKSLKEGDPTSFTVQNKNGVITGKVYDSYLLQPLAQATVTLEGLGSTETGQDGSYSFNNLSASTYTVTASKSPAYGASQASVPVDGNTVTVNRALDRLDLIAPSAYMTYSFEEGVRQGVTEYTGTAVDNKHGSGVALVEAALRKFSDGQYWNGEKWRAQEHWFDAEGSTEWSMAFTGLSFDAQQTYMLLIRATDAAGNAGTSEFYSRPPCPGTFTVDQTQDTPRFSWAAVPGCSYLFELYDSPALQEPILHEYVGQNEYTPSEALADGTYYWHVYTLIGANIYCSQPILKTLAVPWTEPNSVPDGIWKDGPMGNGAPSMNFYVQTYVTRSGLVIASADGKTAYAFLDGDFTDGIDAYDLGGMDRHLSMSFTSETEGVATLTTPGAGSTKYVLYKWFPASNDDYLGTFKDIPINEPGAMSFYVQAYEESIIVIESPDARTFHVFLDADKSDGVDVDSMDESAHLSWAFKNAEQGKATITFGGGSPQNIDTHRWFEAPYSPD